LPRPLQLDEGKITAVFQHIPDPFIVDRIRPSRSEKARSRQTYEEIT
jgi:hypothetical protein